jgi:hypothetical protein
MTRFVSVGGSLDDRKLARALLGEIVQVAAVPADSGGEGPDHLVAISIERAEPPETGDYYTWDMEAALENTEPIQSIEDLRLPGLDADEADAFWHAVND